MDRKRKGVKLLGSFFATYVLVLLLPLLLGFLCYNEALHIVRRDIEYENQAILTQASEVLDAHVEEIGNIGTQLINSTQVVTLRSLTSPMEYPNASTVMDARNAMPKYAAFNDFLFDYLLYFNNGRFAMNDQAVYGYEEFYRLYMHGQGQDYDAWQKETLGGEAAFGQCRVETVEYLRGNQDKAALINLVSFSYAFFPYTSGDGRAVIYIKQDTLLELVSRVDLTGGGSVLIESKEGELLASRLSGDEDAAALQAALREIDVSGENRLMTVAGKNMFVTQTISQKTGLRMTVLQPPELVYSRLTSLRAIIYAVSLFAMLAGAVISYYLAKRNARFIKNIARDDGEKLLHMTYGNALRSLKLSFTDIQNANEDMTKTLAMQKPYLLNNFVSRLVSGDFTSEEEAVLMAKTVDAPILETPLCAVVFRISMDDSRGDATTLQLAASCKAVIQLTVGQSEPRSLFIDRSEEESVLLLGGERIRERAEAISARIRGKLPTDVSGMLFIYVGNAVEALTQVVRSYDNAMSLIYIHPEPGKQPVVFYDETDKPTYALFYPQDMQHHLISCTMTGDEEGMLNLLALLKERNSAEGGMPSFMRQLFINNLLNTLLNVTTVSGLPQTETESICEQIKELMGMPLSVQLAKTDMLFLLLCRAVEKQKNSGQQGLAEKIIAYIDENYMDSELSLTQAADRFGVSESYLSYAFKQQSGENFFSHVENVRMNKAKELLRQTNLKISDIAAQTGYSSPNSFCRAFKRFTGDSASAYRNGAEQ